MAANPNVQQMVSDAAATYGVDPAFALSVAQQESHFDQSQVSPKGARGVMQLTPDTAQTLGVDASDLQQNINGGVRYLGQLLTKYNGDKQLAAAAYNAGPHAVDRHGGVPPYAETQAYVHAVTGSAPASAPPPSVGALYKSMGLGSDGQATPQPTTPSQPSTADQGAPPPVDQILKNVGFDQHEANPSAPGIDKNPILRGAYDAASGVLFGQGPVLSGAEAAVARGGSNLFNGKPVFEGVPQTYEDTVHANAQAQDEYHADHPIAGAATTIGGLAASGLGQLVERGATDVAGRVVGALAPKLAPGAAKVAAGVVGSGAAAGLYGGSQAVYSGEDAGQVAEEAGLSALTGGAFHGLGVAAPKVASAFTGFLPEGAGGALRRIAPAAVGAAGGAGISALTGGNPVLGAVMGAVAGRHLAGGGSAGEPGAADHEAALGELVKASGQDPTQLQTQLATAHPDATTAEALGEPGMQLAQRAANGAPGAEQPLQASLAGRELGAPQRISEAVHEATGISPDSASMDILQQTEAARAAARPLYDAALKGNAVWTPELAEAAEHPLVRDALNGARRLLGPDAMVDNPAAARPTPSQGQLTASPEAYQAWLKSGSTDPTDLARIQAERAETFPQPKQVPSDRGWDMAKQILSYGVDRDHLDRPTSSPTNNAMQRQAGKLGPLLREVIPGYDKALDASGDYKSNQTASALGEKQFSGGPTKSLNGPALEAKFNETDKAGNPKMSQGERAAFARGWLGALYRATEKKGFNPDTILQSPHHQATMRTLFGANAVRINEALTRERDFSAGAKQLGKLKPAADTGHAPSLGTALLVGAESHGLSPAAISHALMDYAGVKGVSDLARKVAAGNLPPKVSLALGRILALPGPEVAKRLQAYIKASQGKVKVQSKASGVGAALARGAGQSAVHLARTALSGL